MTVAFTQKASKTDRFFLEWLNGIVGEFPRRNHVKVAHALLARHRRTKDVTVWETVGRLMWNYPGDSGTVYRAMLDLERAGYVKIERRRAKEWGFTLALPSRGQTGGYNPPGMGQ